MFREDTYNFCRGFCTLVLFISFSDNSGGVSGPGDSGSRSTSGDTGKGELRTGSIEVRVHFESYFTRNGKIFPVVTRHNCIEACSIKITVLPVSLVYNPI